MLCRLYEEDSTAAGAFLVNLNKKSRGIYVKNTIANFLWECYNILY